MSYNTVPSPATLGNEDAIPADERDAAEAFFASFADSDDERATKWRREFYLVLRTGWNSVARRYQANFVCGHDEAIALVAEKCACLHSYERTRAYDSTNHVLGTYERGYYQRCTKCSAEELVMTSRNNWSGD